MSLYFHTVFSSGMSSTLLMSRNSLKLIRYFEVLLAFDGLALHHTHTHLLLFLPQFFTVVFLVNIVQVAIVICHPAAKGTEIVLVPLTFGLTSPCLFITGSETDARLAIEVNAYGNLFVILIENGKDITVLEFLHLCSCEVVTVRHILHVATDDGHRYTENLLAFRVNLE